MITVYGDLSRAGRIESAGMDMTGGTAGELTAEYATPYVPGGIMPTVADIHLPAGFPYMSVSGWRDTRSGPLMRRTWRLSGLKPPEPGNGKEAQPRTRDNPVMTLSTSLEDVPIALHPNIANIMEAYGGQPQPDGTVEFPRTMPKGGTGALWSVDKEKERENPLWGQRVYRSDVLTFTVAWVWQGSKQAPWPPWFGAAGQIDNLPYTKYKVPRQKDRDWLYLGLTSRPSGMLHHVEESWLLSAVGGWNAALFGVESLRLRKKLK